MFVKPLVAFVVSLLLGASATGCAVDASEPMEDAEDGAVGTAEEAISADFICDRRTYGRLDATPARYGQLVAVRTGRPGNYDRFVMEFERGTQVPRFLLVKEADATWAQNEGRPLALEGTRGLSVITSFASGWDMETGKPTYTGPRRFESTTTNVIQEAAQVEDFEGTVHWGLGLSNQVCFRVTRLADPPRLVVDVKRKP